uniref:Uncharacterized protein n=1 Tax=Branchiostoma floridae TaxID=7739 RepID=C3Z6S9_BRAFL|eukprot:XP_002595513.1 hypothetical protein BRAFLDRAFT_69081 [Branchiostoma floridae]
MTERHLPQPPPIFADCPAHRAAAPAEIQCVSRSHVLGLRCTKRHTPRRVMRRTARSRSPGQGESRRPKARVARSHAHAVAPGANLWREHRNSPQQQKPGLPPGPGLSAVAAWHEAPSLR